MAKIQVSFDLQTSESNQNFETKGIRKDNQVTFHDEEGFKHQLMIENNRLRYFKYGKGNLVLIFEEGCTHVGSFETMSHVVNFDTYTELLQINEHTLLVHYKLLTDNEVVHTAQLKLKFAMLEEVNHGRS